MSAAGLGLRAPTPPPSPRRSLNKRRKRKVSATAPSALPREGLASPFSAKPGRYRSSESRGQAAPPSIKKEIAQDFAKGAAPMEAEADADDMGMMEPSPVAAPSAPAAPRRLSVVGRVLLAQPGRLTVSLTAPQALAWSAPARVSVRLSDGRVLSVTVDARKTTHAGNAAAGLTLRLALQHPQLDKLAGDIVEVVCTLAGGLQLHITL